MILTQAKHDWLISVRVGEELQVHVLTEAQATETVARRSALDFALAVGMGQEIYIGMRAVDTDPLLG